MIRILVDPYKLNRGAQKDSIVADESQFVESRLKIRDALHKKKELKVIITNRKIGQWYESLKQYPDVKIEIISPGSILLKELNIEDGLPPGLPVKDSEIQELELIKKAKAHPPQRIIRRTKEIEKWILSVCVDECWGEKGGTVAHLSKIASFFLRSDRDQIHSALEELMDRQKKVWFDSSVGEAYKWLFTDVNSRPFLLYAMLIMKNYSTNMREKTLDELAENNREIIGPIEKYLNQFPPCEFSDDHKKKSELSDLLEIRWKNFLKSTFEYRKSEEQSKKEETLGEKIGEVINEAITKMSGDIYGEINAILDFVKKNRLDFSEDLFTPLAAKFGRFQKQIEEIRKFISPKFPSKPLTKWDWNQMSKWLINEYFPYKKWPIQQDNRDKKIEEFVEIYSEWLYMKYPEFKNQLSPLINGTWYKIKEYIKQGYQVLWIIIDNLCWFYLEDTIKAFKEEELFCSLDPIPCLSMLPSETNISKTSLVAGKLPNQIEINKYQKYERLFEDFCSHNNISTHKTIREDQFRKSKLEKHQITCCIINKLDFSSHRGFFDLDDEIRDFLRRIAKYIKDFLPPGLAVKKFKLIVSTDHGSCIIPQNIRGIKLPIGAKCDNDHKRFIYMDTDANLDKNWYFLNKDKFSLQESIAVTKGYKFIGKRRPKGWVHGGMTPEETFIPHLEFHLEPPEVKSIQCLHSSSPVPIGTKEQKIELSIRNLNDYEISNIILFFPTHSLKISIEKIQPKNETIQYIEIAIHKGELVNNKDKTVTLNGFYSFNCLGETSRGELEIKIKIRKIVDASETAEEFFKF